MQSRTSNEQVEGKNTVMASIKARTLVETEGSHIIRLLIDGVGNVISANIIPKRDANLPTADDLWADENEFVFATLVRVSLPTPAPVPDTSGYLKKIEDERRKKEVASKDAPTSFFGKYWMYIIPFVLFMAMSNAQQQ